jgi:hypothetical protein
MPQILPKLATVVKELLTLPVSAGSCRSFRAYGADMTPMPSDIGRRIRAALAYAGHTSKSMEPLMGSGYKERTMRKLMDDADTSRDVEPKDLILVSHHTGVPVEFFLAPDPWAGWKHQVAEPDSRLDLLLAGVDYNAALIRAGITMLSRLTPDSPIPADLQAEFDAIAEARAEAIQRIERDKGSTGNPR